MLRKLFKSKRIFALALVSVLALVQVKVAIAGCMAANAEAPQVMAMENCPGCETGNSVDAYDAFSRICSNHCLQDDVIAAKVSAQPAPAATVIATIGAATAPPLIAPSEHPPQSGKSRLIYRLQRLLI